MNNVGEGTEIAYANPWVKLAVAMGVRIHRLQLNGALWKHLAATVVPIRYIPSRQYGT